MKRNLFALILSASTLAGCSAGAGLSSSSGNHRFQDGVYTSLTERKAEQTAVAASVGNASNLIEATRNSNIYNKENGLGTKPAYAVGNFVSNLDSVPTIVINTYNPYDVRFSAWPYWYNSWYGPWYGAWCGPGFGPWYGDPFWWDWNWRWSPFWRSYYRGPYYCGPYYYGGGYWDPFWGPRGPSHIPYYTPVYVAPAGNYATASAGGRHGMSRGGINNPVAGSTGRRTVLNAELPSRSSATKVTTDGGNRRQEISTFGANAPRRVATATGIGSTRSGTAVGTSTTGDNPSRTSSGIRSVYTGNGRSMSNTAATTTGRSSYTGSGSGVSSSRSTASSGKTTTYRRITPSAGSSSSSSSNGSSSATRSSYGSSSSTPSRSYSSGSSTYSSGGRSGGGYSGGGSSHSGGGGGASRSSGGYSGSGRR